jgi:hypothetical protein
LWPGWLCGGFWALGRGPVGVFVAWLLWVLCWLWTVRGAGGVGDGADENFWGLDVEGDGLGMGLGWVGGGDAGLGGDGSYMGYGKNIAGAFDSLAGPDGGKGERWRIVAISKGPWLCAERTTKGTLGIVGLFSL